MKLDSVYQLLNYGIFTIPEYQRGYSWTKEQLDDLLDDLHDVEYIKEHYTGTITLIKSGQEKLGITELTKYDIVDGQQRLTTIHLLLVGIFHRLNEIDPFEADEVIIRNVISKGKTLLRLNNNENQDFFFSLLDKLDINEIKKLVPNTKTQKNLLEARLYFYSRLQKHTSVKTLMRFYNNIMLKFKVNIFELEEESEVGLIFETMNDRGLPLSDIDKVKNYLIYLTHRLNERAVAKEINRKFGEMFTQLMSIEGHAVTKLENQFLKCCYIVYSGDYKDLTDIPRKVKTELIKHREVFRKNLFEDEREKKIKDIRSFNSFLHKSSLNYALLMNRTFEQKEINESLFRLSALGKVEMFLPLYLAILSNNRFKVEFLAPINEILETFVVRVFLFGNKKGNTGLTTILELAYKVYANKINFTDLKKELRSLVEKNSNSIEVRRAILNNGVYNVVSTPALKLILLEYEFGLRASIKTNHEVGSYKDMFQNDKISIEHIAPQVLLPGMGSFANVNLLGNLVLTHNNSNLANKTFESKKYFYRHSSLCSEQELSDYSDWNDKSIMERGKKLQRFILDRWKI